MATSKHHDRERRRTKPKTKRTNWAQLLLRPETVTCLMAVGRFIANALWLYHLIVERLRE